MVSPLNITASHPTPARETSSHCSAGCAEALGRKDHVPSTHTGYTTTVPGTGKPTPTLAQAAEKIISFSAWCHISVFVAFIQFAGISTFSLLPSNLERMFN